MSDEEETTQSQRQRRYVAKRGHLKAHLTRFSKFVDAHQLGSGGTELRHRLEKIEEIYNEFEQIQSEIEMIDDSEEQLAERIEFENKYFRVSARAKEIVSAYQRQAATCGTSQSVLNTTNTQQACNFNLPPIAIPHFSGDYEKWSNFRDTYVSLIHDNVTLDEIQKYYYLQSVLEGDALKIIEALEVNGTNYVTAWDLVKERFENKKLIIKSHIKQIFELANITKDSNSALRHFLDTFQTHYRALKNLGEPVEHWNAILIHLLTAKLDFISKREWEIKTRNETNPTITEFIQFLKDRCQLLEATNENSKSGNRKDYTNTSNKRLAHVATNSEIRCGFCKIGGHAIYTCEKFLGLTVAARLEEIKKMKACKNCLKTGHYTFSCKGGSCRICSKKHNTLLHCKTEQHNDRSEEASKEAKNEVETVERQPQVLTNISSENAITILATAKLIAFDRENKPIECRALLDGGAQSNFITMGMCKMLGLETFKINVAVTGINKAATHISSYTKVNMKAPLTNKNLMVTCLIIDKITDCIPQTSIDTANLEIPSNIKLADPEYYLPAEVQVLLGAGIFYDLIQTGKIELGRGLPILLNTKVGWILSGPINRLKEPTRTMCNMSQNAELLNGLEAFWKIEECAETEKIYTREEADCEEHFKKYVERDRLSGKFRVRLPFKEDASMLGDSRQAAERRFYALERKLEKNKEMKKEYHKFMKQYLDMGHMVPIQEEEVEDEGCYLPHHGVIKESSATTKLRVVFDASMKTSSGVALNEILMTGPCIQQSLYFVLIRFRSHRIAIIADVEKMYRCIQMHPQDQKYQMILWREGQEGGLKRFQLATLTYGTAPASFIATRCLKQLAIENEEQYPQAARIISEDFYMDDLLTGASNAEAAIEEVSNVKRILGSAGFHPRKWSSNEPEIIKALNKQGDDENSQYIINGGHGAMVLGVLWEPKEDYFGYTINTTDKTFFTKRVILSIINRIFDPLGLIGPVILKAKTMLQAL